MTSHCLRVFKGSSQGKIVQSEMHKTLGDDEVLVRVTHAGLCGSDLHFKHEDMALGHEGIGIVQEVGSAVTHFKPGDRAGWGVLHDACLLCNDCLTGQEIFCEQRRMFPESDKDLGAFASHAIWKAAFLFHIPDAISSAHAAPLMCAGATVFNALEMYGVRPTERVGVLGVGGLGHLAIQFAARMGCEVVVFSRTPGKEAEARALGAAEFHATQDANALKNVKPVGHLYVTTSEMPDWDMFMSVLAPRGVIYPMTVASKDLSFPNIPALSKGIRIQWTVCASRSLHAKMLQFAAQHHVEPIVQQFPLTVDGIEEAMRKLDSGAVRYRAVLVAKPEDWSSRDPHNLEGLTIGS